MKSERIALLSATLEGGGAERVIVTLANSLYRSGYNVEVVLVNAVGSYLSELDVGLKVVNLSASRVFFALPALMKYLKSTSPHTLLATQGHVNALAIFSRILTRSSVRVLAREANTHSVNAIHGVSWKSKGVNLVVEYLYKYADAIIAPSHGVADDLIEHTNVDVSKVSIISNPLDLEMIHALANEQIRLPFNVNETPMILGVGRLTKQKNFDLLIRAFAKVSEAVNYKLVILGDGEEREQLERLILELNLNDKVLLPGFVENPFSYMKQATVFVLSSRFEGLPNALLQAVAVGVPVVATDCPSGPKEILDNGRWGRLVPVDDSTSMKEAILAGINGDIEALPSGVVTSRYGMAAVRDDYLSLIFSSN